jgi:hypothetical protein
MRASQVTRHLWNFVASQVEMNLDEMLCFLHEEEISLNSPTPAGRGRCPFGLSRWPSIDLCDLQTGAVPPVRWSNRKLNLSFCRWNNLLLCMALCTKSYALITFSRFNRRLSSHPLSHRRRERWFCRHRTRVKRHQRCSLCIYVCISWRLLCSGAR